MMVAIVGILGFTIGRPVLNSVGYSALGRCLEPYASLLCGCVLALGLDRPKGYSAIVAACRPGVGLTLTLAMVVVQACTTAAEGSGLSRVWMSLYTLTATA